MVRYTDLAMKGKNSVSCLFKLPHKLHIIESGTPAVMKRRKLYTYIKLGYVYS